MSYTDHSVKQEIVMLSRYKGLRSSRFLTVLLSLCSINTLYPAGILFTLTGLMLPLMITFAAPEQKKKEPLTQLSSLMRQYRFNTIRFTAERWSSSFLLLFLIAWQWQDLTNRRPDCCGIILPVHSLSFMYCFELPLP